MSDLTGVPAEIRTFLIADVRGYTRFTQERGDEAGARLAARFAEVVREQIEGRGGRVVELRGDEALCVFGSPRAALRAAVDLQRRCVEEIRANPSLPLSVGIGIDAGEAVPVAGGYRGGALNLAARLCSVAGRGEVLVSDGVVHLARRMDEMTYVDRGTQTFKGFHDPVRVYQVGFPLDLPDEPVPADRRRALVVSLAVAATLVVLAAVAAGALLTGGTDHPAALGTNVLGALDSNGHIVGDVHLPGPPSGVAAGAGSVWATVSDADQVERINPKTRAVVDTIGVRPARAPTGVAVGGGGVWVADSGSGEVSWINPADTGAVIKRIRVGQGPGPIAFGDNAAWVINIVDATLQRIDTSFRPGRAVAVGGSPSAVTFGGGWVWVADSGSGSILKIDPQTLQVISRLRVGNDPVGLAYGGGRVWAANAADGTLTRLDPSTQQGTPIPVGAAPSSVTYADGAAWVTTAAGVVRVDGSSVAGSTPTHSTPVASTGTPDGVWVAALTSPASHRGGRLRVAYATDDFGPGFGPFDPAVAPYGDHWQVISMIHDGLVTYRKAGGTAGLQVVPDLAVAMPAVSHGGKTYTFQLRNGIRYSNGRPVLASDFRSSVARALSPAALSIASQGYYQSIVFSNIVGYQPCLADFSSCPRRLLRGIQTNDATGTVTINLTRPDPALPLKLATSFGDFVPPDSPPPNSGKPVAGTGPYMVSRLIDRGHRGVVLVRNPRFRQWSAQAQPSGYPDSMRWIPYRDSGAELTAVERGDADVMVDPPPPARAGELSSRFATLAHPYGGLTTQYLSLNTGVPPFDSVSARRALNLALDRGALAGALGSRSAFVPTCQVLPPGMFGYAPYCPFTIHPDAGGQWTAPDLAAAQTLVARSGTRGDRVVVWAWGGSSTTVLVKPIVRTLNRLGYRASAHVTPPTAAGFGEWNSATANSKKRASAVLTGWSADYPNPIDFLDLLLSCAAFVPGSPSNLNTAELCDPRLDSLIKHAEATQVRNPAQGARYWQQADRRAVDLAPWAPLLNPVGTDVVSARTGNYQHNPEWSVLLDQLWVR